MGMLRSGSLATIASPNSQLVWKIPDEWSMEEAATVPVVYGTVIFALVNVRYQKVSFEQNKKKIFINV